MVTKRSELIIAIKVLPAISRKARGCHPMIKAERIEEIMKILHQKKHVTVDYLSKHIFVSCVTLRRDLREMEAMGLVRKSYGGVSLLEHENKIVPLSLRERDRFNEKNKIAKQAVSLIHEGDTIFMDASSTVLRMADFLEDGMKITVLTNNIRLVIALCEKGITVYCTGGLLLNQSLACVGNYTNRVIESVNADLMFFSAQGLSESGAITDFSETETGLRQLMLSHSKRRYFLCDSSKLGKSFLFTICHIDDIDDVICDKDIKSCGIDCKKAETVT